jgi:hypothetical protein
VRGLAFYRRYYRQPLFLALELSLLVLAGAVVAHELVSIP